MSGNVTRKILVKGSFLLGDLVSVRFRVGGVMWRGGHDGHIFGVLDEDGRTAGFGVICRNWLVFYWGVIMYIHQIPFLLHANLS